MSLIDTIDQVIADAESREVNQTVIRALKNAKRTIPGNNAFPTPKEWDALYKPILEACGVFRAKTVQKFAEMILLYEKTEPKVSETILEIIQERDEDLVQYLARAMKDCPRKTELAWLPYALDHFDKQYSTLAQLFLNGKRKHPGAGIFIYGTLGQVTTHMTRVELPKTIASLIEYVEDPELFLTTLCALDGNRRQDEYQIMRATAKSSYQHVLKVLELLQLDDRGIVYCLYDQEAIGPVADLMTLYKDILRPITLGEIFENLLRLGHEQQMARPDVVKTFASCHPREKEKHKKIWKILGLSFEEGKDTSTICETLRMYANAPEWRRLLQIIEKVDKPEVLDCMLEQNTERVLKATGSLDRLYAEAVSSFLKNGELEKVRTLTSSAVKGKYTDKTVEILSELITGPGSFSIANLLKRTIAYLKDRKNITGLDQEKVITFMHSSGIASELPEELRRYIPLRVVNSLVDAEDLVIVQYPTTIEQAREIYRTKLRLLLGESDDVRQQAEILYEWSSEVIRTIRQEPEKLLYEVAV